jgi:ATP phosphoribosyltransferase
MTNGDRLILAVPSKGRLMDQTAEAMARAGLTLRKVGSERGYRGEIVGEAAIDVIFVSASEIVQQLRAGNAHLGVTGEDLIREEIPDVAQRVELIARLGFGRADVVVAVPRCWLDVSSMADLQEMARTFRRQHRRRLRVATKYMNMTRGFFREKGVTDYLIVESLGATEGTPVAGTADLVVDITTTGSTLKANGLKILDDGVILRSEANLVGARGAPWSRATIAVRDRFVAAVAAAVPSSH